MTRSEAYLDIVWRQFRKNRGAYVSLWVLALLFLLAILAPAIASNQPLVYYDGREYLYPWLRALFNPKELVDLVFNMALLTLAPSALTAVALNVVWARRGVPGRKRLARLLVGYLAIVLLATAAIALPDLRTARIGDQGPSITELFDPIEGGYFVKLGVLCLAGWAALVVGTKVWAASRETAPARWVLPSMYLGELLFAAAAVWGAFHSPEIRPKNLYAARNFPAQHHRAQGTHRAWYVPIPLGPTEQDLQSVYKPPLYRSPVENWSETNDGFLHVFGTDDAGRDALVQLLYGTRISLTIGFVAVSIYMTIGIIVGAMAGYFGGWLDIVASRVVEIVLVFPSFFLILTMVGLIGPSIYIIMVVIGITGWPTISRLIRGEVLKQRQIDYVAAARALGVPNLRIVFRHILPNALSPALVAAPFGVASAIVTEAGLSLLGFGVRPPTPTWGTLLRLGRENYNYWWFVVIPAVAIFITVTVFNLVGGGLRDAMDPRLRR